MAVADRRDIVRLAKLNILLYQLSRYCVTVVGMEFVTVDAVNLYRLAVEQNERTSAVNHRLNFYLSETEMRRSRIKQLIAVVKPYFNVVQIWILVRPKRNFVKVCRQSDGARRFLRYLADLLLHKRDLLALIGQLYLDFRKARLFFS